VLLQKEVDKLMPSIKQPSWHYFSRIKSEESFAQKLETGRVENIREPDDLFACTLVVKNKREILDALTRIETHFHIKFRKPKQYNFTTKDSSSFEFDDLKLYVHIKPPDYLPPSPINTVLFEIQIKTFLEHAWSITTHDLIYKSEDISWSKERVAFQVKALLELVETSINRVDILSRSPELAKQNLKTLTLNKIRDFLMAAFPPESLPDDLLRLCNNIRNLLEYFHLSWEKIVEMLEKETARGRGAETLDLSRTQSSFKQLFTRLRNLSIRPLNLPKTRKQRRYLFPGKSIFQPSQ